MEHSIYVLGTDFGVNNVKIKRDKFLHKKKSIYLVMKFGQKF